MRKNIMKILTENEYETFIRYYEGELTLVLENGWHESVMTYGVEEWGDEDGKVRKWRHYYDYVSQLWSG